MAVFALMATACGDDEELELQREHDDHGAAKSAAPSDADIKALTGKLSGGGASFPDAFYQAVNADFNGVAGQELRDLRQERFVRRSQAAPGRHLDFAGLRLAAQARGSRPRKGPILFFPTVAAPITMSYNLTGVDELQLSPDTIAKIMQAQITTWDDPAIKADNPDATLPVEPDHGRPPLRRFGHDQQLHQVPDARPPRPPGRWAAVTRSTGRRRPRVPPRTPASPR